MIGHHALDAILVLIALVPFALPPSGHRRQRTLFGSVVVERVNTMIVLGGAIILLAGLWFGQPQAIRAAFTCFALSGLTSMLSRIVGTSPS